MRDRPANTDDVIDSRDVIAAIEELAELIETDDATDEDRETLADLVALAREAEHYAEDWRYGETLIRDTYFEDYARELAEELDLISSDTRWPATCIDWGQAARELRMDYTAVDFAGITYWVR